MARKYVRKSKFRRRSVKGGSFFRDFTKGNKRREIEKSLLKFTKYNTLDNKDYNAIINIVRDVILENNVTTNYKNVLFFATKDYFLRKGYNDIEAEIKARSMSSETI